MPRCCVCPVCRSVQAYGYLSEHVERARGGTWRSPVDQRQRRLVFINRLVKLDKLDIAILVASVEVRDLHVNFERLRYCSHLDMIYDPAPL